MKAVIWTQYGKPDVLQLQEVQKPDPKPGEVRIKIHAATVTAGDCEARSLQFPFWLALPMRLFVGIRKPGRIRILGQELAGEVEAVGTEVTRFKPGDRVFGTTGFRFGAYAEYTCLPADSDEGALALIPKAMSYEEAAALPTGGLEALHFLRRAAIQPGEHLLINGAGGSIGTIAIQLAKHFGAKVTGVDSTDKLDMLRSIGADHVVDYKKEDFTRQGQTYDVIFDVIGKSRYADCIRCLNPKGRYLLGNPILSSMLRSVWTGMRTDKRVLFGTSEQRTEDLLFLKELVEAGTLRIIIDRRYPLAETSAAHHYVETGAKQGNIIITVR